MQSFHQWWEMKDSPYFVGLRAFAFLLESVEDVSSDSLNLLSPTWTFAAWNV